ncbi:MAG: FAD-dependent oxidoreductase, partial [Pseudomonadota bacterium]
LDDLRARYDAVFLGIGLSGVNALSVEGADQPKVQDAVGFIAALRQSENLATLPVGRNVVVIGGGMTAVDAAVQAKKLGAEAVSLVYRRGREAMNASRFEQDLAAKAGVRIIANATPKSVNGGTIELAYTESGPDGLKETGETFTLAADEVLTAIGQRLSDAPDLALEGGKIAVTGAGRTSMQGVWAGGDCATGGDDLTVTAVAEGRDAAEDIHRALLG